MGMFFKSLNGAPFLLAVDEPSKAACVGNFSGGLPPSAACRMAVSPNQRWLAVPHNATPFLTVYDLETLQKVSLAANPGAWCAACTFSADGSQLYVAVGNSANPIKYLRAYNTADWSRFDWAGSVAPGNIVDLHASPTGRWLAAAFATTPYHRVWDLDNGLADVALPSVLPAAGNSLHFSPDGTRLAVGFNTAPGLRLYNTADWSEINLGALSFGVVKVVKWSPDGTRLFVGSSTNPGCFIVDLTTLSVVNASSNFLALAAAWSDDGLVIMASRSSAPYDAFIDPTTGSLTHGAFNSGSPGSSYASVVYVDQSPPWVGAVPPNVIRDINGNPAAREVLAHDAAGNLLASTISAANGTYRLPFNNFDPVRLVFKAAPGEGNDQVLANVVPSR